MEPSDWSWTTLGACRGMPVRLFYPERGDSAKHLMAARKACSQCPVRLLCQEAGIDGDEDGMWGGLLKRARHNIVYRRTEVRLEHGSGYRALIRHCSCRRCQSAREVPLQAQLFLKPWPERQDVELLRVARAEEMSTSLPRAGRVAGLVYLTDRRRRRRLRLVDGDQLSFSFEVAPVVAPVAA